MNLVKFLIFGAILSTIFGEFGHFPFGSSSGAIYLSDLFLSFAVMFFIIWKVVSKSKIFIPPAFKYVALFWAMGALSLAWSLTFFPISEVFVGSLYLLRFVLYSTTLLLVFNLKKDGLLHLDQLLQIFLVNGIFIALLGFIQLAVLPNFESPQFLLTSFGFDPHQGRLTSSFLDPNFVGAYLVLTLAILSYYLLRKKGGTWMKVAYLVILAAVTLTFSRSAYLMLLILLVGLGLLSKLSVKKWLTSAVIALVVVGAGFLTVPRFYQRLAGAVEVDASAGERFESWQKGLEVFKVSPIVGIGFNNFRWAQERLNLFKIYSVNGGHAGAGVDSSLLLVLSTTGAVGLAAYILFWVVMLKKTTNRPGLFPKILLAALAGLLINSQFINSLFFPAIMLWYFSIIGVSFRADRLPYG